MGYKNVILIQNRINSADFLWWKHNIILKVNVELIVNGRESVWLNHT